MSTTTPTKQSTLVSGFNHVAQTTQDLDRLVAFYGEMMDIPFEELSDPRARHGFLHLGSAILHVFEIPVEMTQYGDADAMFRRGRLDHIAIEAADEFALATIRDRLVAAGHSDGVVTIFDDWLLSVHVVDPDGMRLEVTCRWTRDVFGPDDVSAPVF